jgi:hypothetical protein
MQDSGRGTLVSDYAAARAWVLMILTTSVAWPWLRLRRVPGRKPDLLTLALDAYADFNAEAVFIVSNKSTTTRLVHDLERRPIPAFGPIWDS